MKKVWIIMLALALLLGLAACGQTQAPAATDQGNNVTTTQGQEAQTAAPTQNTNNTNNGTVTQSGSSANFDLAVTGVNHYELSSGNEAILIECSLTNKSATEQAISSVMYFSAADTSNNQLTSFLSEDMMNVSMELASKGVTIKTIDGNVQAGGTLTGSVIFTAPKGTKVGTLTFDSMLTNDKITLQLGGI
ncbi:MAG: DUF5067 domain-containing protein [Bacillota bacterium]